MKLIKALQGGFYLVELKEKDESTKEIYLTRKVYYFWDQTIQHLLKR
jgi:hypothetical protein